jgi:hypothetical protein
MRILQKLGACGVLGLVLTFAMTPAAMASGLKAGMTAYVDDIPGNNGSINCPETAYTSPVAAMLATGFTNATIIFCPGTYTLPDIAIANASNLKLIAKGTVILKPIVGHTGNLLGFTNSDKVTIQGFVIDGGSDLGGGDAYAISFSNTSGSILKNQVLHWHEPDLGASIVAQGGIIVVGGTGKVVKIDHNTIFDFQRTGIRVLGDANVAISHNLLIGSAGALGYTATPIKLEGALAGSISSNTIRSDNEFVNVASGSGIHLFESSNIKVKGNTIDGLYSGIFIEGSCDNLPASGNLITGNKVSNTRRGVHIRASWGGACTDLVANNTISGNTFTNFSHDSNFPVYMATVGTGVVDATKVTGNKFYGYPGTTVVGGAGVTNTVESGNKTFAFPVPGI